MVEPTSDCDYDAWGADFGAQAGTRCLNDDPEHQRQHHPPAPSEPTSGPRAAQIQAVRDVLGRTSLGPAAEDFAAELVDAVHAAGRDQDEARIPADQVGAYAAGWAAAVKTLLDTATYKRWHQQVYATTGVDHHRWQWNARVTLADYLEAVGPGGEGQKLTEEEVDG